MPNCETRKITAELQADLLAKAMEYSGEGITKTLNAGLEELIRKMRYEKFAQARGQFKDLQIDITALREDKETSWM